MSQRAILNEEEKTALDAIAAAHRSILDLGLKANHQELVAGIHVLQGFVIQHMLQRIEPGHWGRWFE